MDSENEEMEIDGLNKQQKSFQEYENRDYQSYLFERAKEENIIICLPTGCGKTFIAVQLVKHYIREALELNKKIIFVATTVPLVHQQGRYLKDHIGSSYSSIASHVGIVTGDMKPEDWDGAKWKDILSKSEIFSMTDQILRHAIERAHILWKNLALIILDECHNATKSHPMASLMDLYCEERVNGGIIGTTLPRVLGLTATIVNGNSKSNCIEVDIAEIEKKFCAKAVTYHKYEEVLKCATSAKIHIRSYPRAAKHQGEDSLAHILEETIINLEKMGGYLLKKATIVDEINDLTLHSANQVFFNNKNPLKDFSKYITEVLEVLNEMGPFCARNAAWLKLAYLHRMLLQNSGNNDNAGEAIVANYLITQLDHFIFEIEDFMFIECGENSSDVDFVVKFNTPKLQTFLEILSNTDHKTLCGIVFCTKRTITQMLCYYIQDLKNYKPEVYGSINVNFVLGTSGTQNMTVMKAALAKQTEVLNDFRQKRLNLLIATKVLEEGLNVPSCNLIIRYDPIITYPSFVQSMGRARQKGALFYALVEETETKDVSRINEYKEFSTRLSECLKRNVEHPENYFEIGDDNSVDENVIPSFCPGNGPQKITAGSAIEIVYRYCQFLAHDKLSIMAPVSWWKEVQIIPSKLYVVHVRLPPGSLVKEAKGGAYSTKTLAKRAAFLEVCKKLYEVGALHEKTLLPIPRQIPKYVCEFLDALEENETEIVKPGQKMGSKNRTTWYPKLLPKVFTTNGKQTALNVYAVVLRLQSYFGAELLKEHLYTFETQQYLYGIVTSADLTKVPDFLMFSHDGNFKVELKKVQLVSQGCEVTLTGEEIGQLKAFQSSVFLNEHILKLNQCYFTDSVNNNTYYVAPLRAKEFDDVNLKAEVAWDLIDDLISGMSVNYKEEMSIANRKKLNSENIDYSNSLVIPWYNPEMHDRQTYCVLSVDREKSPKSPFDNVKKYATYKEYYLKKYNIEVVNNDSPLLLVKPVSQQLNYLTLKYGFDAKKKKEDRQDSRFTSGSIYLIPEFVRKHPLPVCLYVQAKMLPSCIHRIQRLLLGQEILDSVSSYHSDWKKASYFGIDRSVRNKSALIEQEKEITQSILPILKSLQDKKTVEKLTVSQPNSGISSAASGTYVAPKRVPGSYSSTRKLLWVEIEYIHPKNIPFIPDEDDDENDDEGLEGFCIEDNSNAPPSPPTYKSCDIELVSLGQVPIQNFNSLMNLEQTEGPLASTIMESITLANGNDSISLEKLEMMGDSVLKLVVTLHIFTHFPECGEGAMTSLRTKLISNKCLYRCGKKKNLGEYLAGSIFLPEHSWLPPGVEIPSKLIETAGKKEVNYTVFLPIMKEGGELSPICFNSMEDDELAKYVDKRMVDDVQELQRSGPTHTSFTHSRIGDKSVADAVEALIGAYYDSGGIDSALKLMDWMGLRGPTKNPKESKPYMKIEDLPTLVFDYPEEDQTLVPFLHEIEEVLSYSFKNKWLMVEALTHPTYIMNRSTSAYQRLEFLGDAVLDFLVTHYIYVTKKAVTPGKLTDLRSALVNNITFGSLAVRYGFHKHLLHFSNQLEDAVDLFESCQVRNGHKVTGHFKLLTDTDCIVAKDIDVPKALGDVFESVIGAVFIDSGLNLDLTWSVVYRLMKHEIDEFSKEIPLAPVRELHERFPGIKFVNSSNISFGDTEVKLVSVQPPGHDAFKGCGKTKKNARQAAAKYALKTIKDVERKAKSLVK